MNEDWPIKCGGRLATTASSLWLTMSITLNQECPVCKPDHRRSPHDFGFSFVWDGLAGGLCASHSSRRHRGGVMRLRDLAGIGMAMWTAYGDKSGPAEVG
jgi:hypothetical protein